MTHACACTAQRTPCRDRVPVPGEICYTCRTVCPPTRPTTPRGIS